MMDMYLVIFIELFTTLMHMLHVAIYVIPFSVIIRNTGIRIRFCINQSRL